MKTKKIFKRALALELVAMGNVILETEKNTKKHWLTVYLFLDDSKLQRDMSAIQMRNN